MNVETLVLPPIAAPRRRAPMARFVWRDLRGGISGLRVVFLCIALGVAAIVGVQSLAEALNDGLGREGRTILGGDASFSLIHRRLAPEERAFLESRGALSTVATLRAMAQTNNDAALVEIKAVESGWPSLGAAVFDPPMGTAQALAEKDGAFGAAVEPALLARLGLKVGDRFRIGQATFVATTILKTEPDRLGVGVGLGPRALISQPALDATGLIQPGSLIRWTTRVAMNAGAAGAAPDDAAVNALLADAKKAFPQAGWETRSRLAVSPDFSRDLDRFAEFLTLAGLLSLVVGGVGVANAAQGFVERKRASLAILKAIGASGGWVVGLAALEFLLVAFAGALAGAALGAAIPFIVAFGFADLIPVPLAPTVKPAILLLGLAYGLMTALVFSILPLGQAHDLPVATLIRDLAEERRAFPRARYVTLALIAALGLIALAIGTSPQPKVAGAVVAATLVSFVVLRVVAAGIAFGARHAPEPRSVVIRMALSALHRPGALTASVVLSLGLGLAALVALSLIDFNMRAQLRRFEPGVTPNFFFLDVRGKDAGSFVDFVRREAPDAKISEVPMMRGRFVRLGGIPAEKVKARDNVAWALEGDRGVTFAAEPPKGSEVVEGRWWPADYSGPPLVSMEKDVAEGLGVKIGDTVVVNVMGRNIEARVANLRKVNWRSYTINFVLVYPPNVFRGAPFSELVSAALPGSVGPDKEIALLREVAKAYPEVASVRVREALETVEALVAKLALAIRAATGVALTTSVLVLASALAANRRARLGDATVLKILGATRLKLSAMFLTEYAILGAATAAFGVGAGTLAAWLTVDQVMQTDFVFDWRTALAAAGGGLAVTIGLGMIGAWRVLSQKPAAYLREL